MKRFFVLFFAVLFLLCFQTSTVFSSQEGGEHPLILEKIPGDIFGSEQVYSDPGWHSSNDIFFSLYEDYNCSALPIHKTGVSNKIPEPNQRLPNENLSLT